MIRNQAGQSVHILAFDQNGRRSGIAGTLSCTLAIDSGDRNALDDATPEEIGTTGEYLYSLTQGETDGHALSFVPGCSIPGVQVMALPSNVIYTRSAVTSGATKTDVEAATKAGVTKLDLDPHYRGDTWAGIPSAYFRDGDENPIDLTGASIRMQVKRSSSDRTALMEWSTDDSSITIPDAVAGQYSVLSRIVDLPGRTYEYDVEVTLADGSVLTSLFGCWTIEDDITR